MHLFKALALPESKGVTALVGGGGKTSLMYRLGAEYARAGHLVIVTTTTRIGDPGPEDGRLILADSPEIKESLTKAGTVVCVGQRDQLHKLRFPGEAIWARCVQEADRVFVEADGSRNLPAKAAAEHEPVIPKEADTVIAVAGLTALEKPIRESVFRWVLACPLLDESPDTLLTPALLARLLTSPQGQFKGVDDVGKYRVFLNQADDAHMAELGVRTAKEILTLLPGCRVVIGTLRPAVKVWTV